jgi:hypothetical protein
MSVQSVEGDVEVTEDRDPERIQDPEVVGEVALDHGHDRSADDRHAEQTRSFAQQISIIRLQLKRLLSDQKVLGAEIERRALGR